MDGVNDSVRDNVRKASQGLARGRCHWARTIAELSFVALSEAKGRSRGAEILRCVWNDGYMWGLWNRPAFQGKRVLVTLAYSQASCPVCRLFTVLTFYHTRPWPSSSRFTLVHGECVGPGNHHNVRECQRMSGTFVFLPRCCEERNPCGVLESGALPRRPALPKARLPCPAFNGSLSDGKSVIQ